MTREKDPKQEKQLRTYSQRVVLDANRVSKSLFVYKHKERCSWFLYVTSPCTLTVQALNTAPFFYLGVRIPWHPPITNSVKNQAKAVSNGSSLPRVRYTEGLPRFKTYVRNDNKFVIA